MKVAVRVRPMNRRGELENRGVRDAQSGALPKYGKGKAKQIPSGQEGRKRPWGVG